MPLRKLSKCHTNIVELIQKAAEILNISNIDYTIKLGCDDIDTFYSGIYNIQIRGFNKDNQKIEQTLVLKHHIDSESRSALRECYRREILFFSKAVPRFLEIQRGFKIIEGLRIKFPNCILIDDEFDKEAIGMMGLLNDGFGVRDRLQRLDLEHATLVMKYLAKLHALSFILEKWKPEEFEDLMNSFSRDVQYADPSRQSKSIRCFYDVSVSVVSDPVAKDQLKALAPKLSSILHKCTQNVKNYSTICHGDCWNNNVLFKFKDHRPVDVIVMDYQLMRYASPVTDLVYFLYMSADQELLTTRYETILNIYYGTLSAVLRQCNLRAEDVYPRNIFEEHLRKFSVFGLVEALISMMIITAPFEEALKMTEIKYQFRDEGVNESPNNDIFKERVNDIVGAFFSRNYSLDAVINSE